MSKIANAMLMLEYLNTGNKYKVKELSQKLGITERMVRYYKQELETAGIPIETFMGPDGGYYILKTTETYNQFNKYDIELLEDALNSLNKSNYQNLEKFQKLILKIKHISNVEEERSKYFITNKIEDNSKLYFTLNKAIVNKERLLILYKNLKQEWKERYIHPMHIFKYDNHFYVTAFCELRNDIRHFEFSRIKIVKEK